MRPPSDRFDSRNVRINTQFQLSQRFSAMPDWWPGSTIWKWQMKREMNKGIEREEVFRLFAPNSHFKQCFAFSSRTTNWRHDEFISLKWNSPQSGKASSVRQKASTVFSVTYRYLRFYLSFYFHLHRHLHNHPLYSVLSQASLVVKIHLLIRYSQTNPHQLSPVTEKALRAYHNHRIVWKLGREAMLDDGPHLNVGRQASISRTT